jgi:hypothetical protein
MHRLSFRFAKVSSTFIGIQTLHHLTDDQGEAKSLSPSIGPDRDLNALDRKWRMKRQAELDKPASYARFCSVRPQSIGLLLMHESQALLVEAQQGENEGGSKSESEGKSWAPPMSIRQGEEEVLTTALRSLGDKLKPVVDPYLLSYAISDPGNRLYIMYDMVYQLRFKAIYILEVPKWIWEKIDLSKMSEIAKIDLSKLTPKALEALSDNNLSINSLIDRENVLEKDISLGQQHGKEINIDKDFAKIWLTHHVYPEFFD